MTVVGTVGLPGSGKGEAAAVARELGVPVITMGDVVRDACRRRGLDPATDHGTVAKQLRAEDGPTAIAERSIPRVQSALTDHDVALVDGIRSDAEVERFRAVFDPFVLVSIEAPREIRRDRLANRGRDAGHESLRERDQRERDFGMGEAMAQADVTVHNTDSLSAFHEQIRSLLSEYQS